MSSRERTGPFRIAIALGWALVVALGLLGCGGSGEPKKTACAPGEVAREDGGCEPKACGPGELTRDDGSCQPAGLPPDMPCPPGQLTRDDGSCQPAGVPPEACADGFVPDGSGGCEAILPDEACPRGQMAIPGETRCREVAPCGEGTWGDIPVDASTQFVDQAYAGSDSDGTREKPWTTIQRAITAAASGAIVAVAEGSYAEDVGIAGKAVRLWGRCPARVEIQGRGVREAAVNVLRSAAGGTEIRSLAVSGARSGIWISGARDVALDAVWVHETGLHGIDVVGGNGATSVVVTVSLVEQSRELGVGIWGSDATLEASVVKGTRPTPEGIFGRGIGVSTHPATGVRGNLTIRACLVEQNQERGVTVSGSDATIEASVVKGAPNSPAETGGGGIGAQADSATGERANLTVRACLVEQNHGTGVFVAGSDATIEASVVKGSLPTPDGTSGRGIGIQSDPATGERANVTVRACLVEQNHEQGVFVAGSDATFEAAVIRGNLPTAEGTFGRGLSVQDNPATGEHANVTVRACLVEQNHDVGLLVVGSDATIEASVFKGNLPTPERTGGGGIGIQDDEDTGERANVTVHACLVEQNHYVGVHVSGSDATIDASVVTGTLPSPEGTFGRAIGIQANPATYEGANVIVRACLVEQNHEQGAFVWRSDAIIEDSMVRDTRTNYDGAFGDGITVLLGTATIQNVTVSGNARAGVANWGSQVTIVDTTLTCSAFALNGETIDQVRASFDGSHGWRCTRRGADAALCAETEDRCVVDTAHVEPPPPLEPLPPL